MNEENRSKDFLRSCNLQVLANGTKDSKQKGKTPSQALRSWFELHPIGADFPPFEQVLRIRRMQLFQAGYPWWQGKEEVVALFQHCGPFQQLGV